MISKLDITQGIEKADFAVFGIVVQRWTIRSVCLGIEVFMMWKIFFYQDLCCCIPLYLCYWKVTVMNSCCCANITLSLAGVPSQSTVELATSVCVALITTANGSTTAWERGITGKSLALWQEHDTASVRSTLLFPGFSCISARSVLSHTEPLFCLTPAE